MLAEILRELQELRAERRAGDPDARWMRLVLDNALDAITIVDPDGTIRYANHMAGRGDPTKLVGHNTLDLVPAAARTRWRDLLRSVVDTGETKTCELESVSGYAWYARLVPIKEAGRVTSILNISTDLTPLREAERELHRTEQDLGMALEAARVGLWRWNIARDELVWDQASRELFRYEGDAPLTIADYLGCVHPEDRARVSKALDHARATGEWQHVEHRVAPRDSDETRWLLARARVLTNDRGEMTDILGAAVDITTVKSLEFQLRQSQKLEAVGQLAGGIAHDFNNLILVINLSAQAAELDPSEAESSLASIRHAADRAAALARQLLAFSHRHEFTISAIDVNASIESTLRLLRRVLPETIRVDFVPEHDLLPAQADAGGLEQILTNLCINARDAMERGGRLTIATANVVVDDRYRDSHPWAQPGPYVQISVTDTGAGMSSTVHNRIFEPFFTTKEAGRGTGLGLATVYGIIKQFHGIIDVDTTVGHGTTFKVFLPSARQHPLDEEAALPGVMTGGTETLLLAEDEQIVRDVLSQLLRRAGYSVITATDGDKALATFRDHRAEISLVLLDLVMPRMAASDALEEILQTDPEMPIILSSGYADAQALAGSTREGMVLLHKPFDAGELLQAVRSAIDRRNVQR